MLRLSLLIIIILNQAFFHAQGYYSSSGYYDSKLDNIAWEFVKEVYDVEKCKDLSNQASGVDDEIDRNLKSYEYTQEEKVVLNNLRKEAVALENVIRELLPDGYGFPKLEEFYLANRRIGGIINKLSKENEYCFDVFSLTINNLAFVLVHNSHNSVCRFESKCYIEGDKFHSTHTLTAGVSGNSLRCVLIPREYENVKVTRFLGVTCECNY